MSEKLKPCPFCGCDSAEIVEDGASSYVECLSCLARTGEFASSEHAVEAWDRRATKGDREPSLPLLARISYPFGEIVNLNEEIANLRNEVTRLTSENIGYREKQSFTKKFGAKAD